MRPQQGIVTAAANLIWNPVAFVDIGFEYFWGHRLTVGNARGRRERPAEPLPRAVLDRGSRIAARALPVRSRQVSILSKQTREQEGTPDDRIDRGAAG